MAKNIKAIPRLFKTLVTLGTRLSPCLQNIATVEPLKFCRLFITLESGRNMALSGIGTGTGTGI